MPGLGVWVWGLGFGFGVWGCGDGYLVPLEDPLLRVPPVECLRAVAASVWCLPRGVTRTISRECLPRLLKARVLAHHDVAIRPEDDRACLWMDSRTTRRCATHTLQGQVPIILAGSTHSVFGFGSAVFFCELTPGPVVLLSRAKTL